MTAISDQPDVIEIQPGPSRRPGKRYLPKLRIGDLVEVRSPGEILATLDGRGELDGLPFMPEMLPFCGRRFRVRSLAIKLCDTIDWSGMHRMDGAVHLEDLRCDGAGHDGCQAGCLLYWKEAWLRPVGEATGPAVTTGHRPAREDASAIASSLLANSRGPGTEPGTERFFCQTTEILRAAPERISPLRLGQYVRDIRSGNARPGPMLRSIAVGAFNEYQDFSRRRLPVRLRIHEGRRYPFIDGRQAKTPHQVLNLREGDLVEVKSAREIFETLDPNRNNRGLSFDAEMLKYCGRQARVLRRVERIVDEKTGVMLEFKNPCIVLENVTCDGDYHQYCPRSIYPYWREIWLRRIDVAEGR